MRAPRTRHDSNITTDYDRAESSVYAVLTPVCADKITCRMAVQQYWKSGTATDGQVVCGVGWGGGPGQGAERWDAESSSWLTQMYASADGALTGSHHHEEEEAQEHQSYRVACLRARRLLSSPLLRAWYLSLARRVLRRGCGNGSRENRS